MALNRKEEAFEVRYAVAALKNLSAFAISFALTFLISIILIIPPYCKCHIIECIFSGFKMRYVYYFAIAGSVILAITYFEVLASLIRINTEGITSRDILLRKRTVLWKSIKKVRCMRFAFSVDYLLITIDSKPIPVILPLFVKDITRMQKSILSKIDSSNPLYSQFKKVFNH